MFLIERHQAILDLLNNNKSVTVKDLSFKLKTGEATIRRDLAKLEQAGELKRTHGGAVLYSRFQSEIPLIVRESEKEDEKKQIAGFASRLIHDGDFLIMDSSSTTLRMIPYLKNFNNLTVLTNGAKTAVDLAGIPGIKVYSTGGLLREKSLSYIGSAANKQVSNFNADLLFFSCRALSMEKGLSDFDEREASLRKEMIRAGRKVVLLCDRSKFDETSYYRIGAIDCISTIVTDSKPPETWIDYLVDRQIELIY
ncbi:MAG: DeoR/GlpR family DNA-binding transcription regulator [Spirochaetales bacterium]|nr:DeoR/GlpR family DNA-binding transcription regulator [Spirochaetales bacterium]